MISIRCCPIILIETKVFPISDQQMLMRTSKIPRNSLLHLLHLTTMTLKGMHAGAPLAKWRYLLQSIQPREWSAVKQHTPEVMKLIADPRILRTAALALQRRGPRRAEPRRKGTPGFDVAF